MALRLALIVAATALFAGAALAQEPASAAEEAPPACDGQVFVFESGLEGHVAKVTLCSKRNPTPDDLARMFESAASTLAQNRRMAVEKRDDLVAQLKAKAAEVSGGKPAATASIVAGASPTSALAPLRSTSPPDSAPEYSALPPIPAPVATTASAVAASSAPLLGKPQLTLECLDQDDIAGAGPCDSLARATILTVRADAAVPAGTSLRFLRRGDLRAEVELAQLARGKSTQFALPREVCAGVAESKVEIEVIRRAAAKDAGQVVDTMGPYFLRC